MYVNYIKNTILLIGILLLVTSCDTKKKSTTADRAFELLTNGIKNNKLKYGEDVKMSIHFVHNSHDEVKIFKIFVNNKLYKQLDGSVQSFSIPTSSFSLGKQSIQLKAEFADAKTFTATRDILILSDQVPNKRSFEIVKTYPHDKKAYTQGLEFSSSGVMYESTGQYGLSDLRKVNFKNGSIQKIEYLEDHFFGEGMTLLFDHIYQLTWQEMSCLVYNRSDLKKIKTIGYTRQMEGWGLCNNGKQLIMSDGTENIYFLNPQTLEIEKSIQVYNDKGKVVFINEMEYVNGKIYANIYTTDTIIVIDSKTGKVETEITLKGLLKESDYHDEIDVLNGIAYHKEKESFFITGKNWPKLFELKFKGLAEMN